MRVRKRERVTEITEIERAILVVKVLLIHMNFLGEVTIVCAEILRKKVATRLRITRQSLSSRQTKRVSRGQSPLTNSLCYHIIFMHIVTAHLFASTDKL